MTQIGPAPRCGHSFHGSTAAGGIGNGVILTGFCVPNVMPHNGWRRPLLRDPQLFTRRSMGRNGSAFRAVNVQEIQKWASGFTQISGHPSQAGDLNLTAKHWRRILRRWMRLPPQSGCRLSALWRQPPDPRGVRWPARCVRRHFGRMGRMVLPDRRFADG